MTGAEAPSPSDPVSLEGDHRTPAEGPRLRPRIVLYLAGESPNSVIARANLRVALAARPSGEVELEIVDVLVDPERAASAGILMTPMLVRVSPGPERRILGNLRDRAILCRTLGFEVPRE